MARHALFEFPCAPRRRRALGIDAARRHDAILRAGDAAAARELLPMARYQVGSFEYFVGNTGVTAILRELPRSLMISRWPVYLYCRAFRCGRASRFRAQRWLPRRRWSASHFPLSGRRFLKEDVQVD